MANKKMENMDQFWSKHSKEFLKTDKFGYAAVCYTGMPIWFNKFMDKYQKKAFMQLTKNLNFNDKKILDVGCGVGRWCKLFVKYSNDVTGIDIDKLRLVKAKENINNSNVKLKNMLANEMKFKKEEFDLVNSITVLQHIPYKEKYEAIKEIGRVTKKGGFVIIIELSDMFDDDKHVFPLKKNEWIRRFEAEGFKLIKENGYEYIPVLRLIRRLKFIVTGGKTINKENGKAKLSFLELFLLKIVIIISYPIESFCSSFLSNKYARHVGLLFKKIK